MTHKLKVKLEGGTKIIEVDGVEIGTIAGISLRTVRATAVCDLIRNTSANNSFGATFTTEEGEIEIAIPDTLADALAP